MLGQVRANKSGSLQRISRHDSLRADGIRHHIDVSPTVNAQLSPRQQHKLYNKPGTLRGSLYMTFNPSKSRSQDISRSPNNPRSQDSSRSHDSIKSRSQDIPRSQDTTKSRSHDSTRSRIQDKAKLQDTTRSRSQDLTRTRSFDNTDQRHGRMSNGQGYIKVKDANDFDKWIPRNYLNSDDIETKDHKSRSEFKGQGNRTSEPRKAVQRSSSLSNGDKISRWNRKNMSLDRLDRMNRTEKPNKTDKPNRTNKPNRMSSINSHSMDAFPQDQDIPSRNKQPKSVHFAPDVKFVSRENRNKPLKRSQSVRPNDMGRASESEGLPAIVDLYTIRPGRVDDSVLYVDNDSWASPPRSPATLRRYPRRKVVIHTRDASPEYPSTSYRGASRDSPWSDIVRPTNGVYGSDLDLSNHPRSDIMYREATPKNGLRLDMSSVRVSQPSNERISMDFPYHRSSPANQRPATESARDDTTRLTGAALSRDNHKPARMVFTVHTNVHERKSPLPVRRSQYNHGYTAQDDTEYRQEITPDNKQDYKLTFCAL